MGWDNVKLRWHGIGRSTKVVAGLKPDRCEDKGIRQLSDSRNNCLHYDIYKYCKPAFGTRYSTITV